MQKCQKLKFFEWSLEAGSKTESIPIHLHVKMPIFTAEINMVAAWYKTHFLRAVTGSSLSSQASFGPPHLTNALITQLHVVTISRTYLQHHLLE